MIFVFEVPDWFIIAVLGGLWFFGSLALGMLVGKVILEWRKK